MGSVASESLRLGVPPVICKRHSDNRNETRTSHFWHPVCLNPSLLLRFSPSRSYLVLGVVLDLDSCLILDIVKNVREWNNPTHRTSSVPGSSSSIYMCDRVLSLFDFFLGPLSPRYRPFRQRVWFLPSVFYSPLHTLDVLPTTGVLREVSGGIDLYISFSLRSLTLSRIDSTVKCFGDVD